MSYKDFLGLFTLVLFLVSTVSAAAPLTVSLSSNPTLPATLNVGQVVTFNAIATGGSGTYNTYNFSLINSVSGNTVNSVLVSSNLYAYTIPTNQVGSTLYANVVVTDNSLAVANSIKTGILTVNSTVPGKGGAKDPGLGTAANFAILAETSISTAGAPVIGDIGISPAAATYITGFGLILDSSTQFSTSSLLTGSAYAADYSPPTPVKYGNIYRRYANCLQ